VIVRLAPLIAALAFAGCSGTQDPTPEKLDGTPSYEFEQEDLDAAASASDRVKEYCAGAVSEAQRLGCESHVTDADLP
jgi:outer membrane PBP1 activator LpoA protein